MSYTIHFNADTMRFGRDTSQRLNRLNLTFRKIHSGLRINNARDDVAGLGVSTRLESQLKQVQAELRGSGDQLSLLQTVDDALAKAQERLFELREIAVRASNDTHSFLDRQTLTEEFKSVMRSLDEIAQKTEFNGVKILENADELMLSLDHTSAPQRLLKRSSLNSSKLGRQSQLSSLRRGLFLDPLNTGELSINGIPIRGTSSYDDQISYSQHMGSAIAKAKAINQASPYTRVEASVEENVVMGTTPIEAIDLSGEHSFKINGWGVAGFKVQSGDANHELINAINAGYSSSGVRAELSVEGALILNASDGRNITIEYSDIDTHNAIGIIDIFGDPVNLNDTVRPAIYKSAGDITALSFETEGSYNDQSIIEGSWQLGDEVTLDATGAHRLASDYADYYLEIVKPGGIGEATYRIKAEAVPEGTSDVEPELGDFNTPGLVSFNGSDRVLEAEGSSYHSASDRQYILKVTSRGDPSVGQSGANPRVNIYEVNLDDGVSEEVLIQSDVEVVAGEAIDLGHGLIIEGRSLIGQYIQTNDGVKTYVDDSYALSDLSVDQIFVAEGHDYTHGPRLKSWSGSTATEFTFEVVKNGHSSPSSSTSYADETSAWVRVTATELATGVVTSTTITNLNPRHWAPDYHSLAGLTFSFPIQYDSGRMISSPPAVPNFFYDYSYSYYHLMRQGVFTNEIDRQYDIVVQEDGPLTSQNPIDIVVNVYDVDSETQQRTLVQSYDDMLVNGKNMMLGTINEDDQGRDGVVIVFGSSVAILGYGSKPNPDINVDFNFNDYSDPENRIAVFEITEAGEIDGGAAFVYYYQDSPDDIIDSGFVTSGDVLNNGISYVAGLADGVTSASFAKGEKWYSDIRAKGLRTGDTVTVAAEARDLEVGTTWSITAYNDAEWLVGDEIQINASRSYDTEERTLTDTIRYQVGDEVLMGDVKLTGVGDFKTGDLIKIKTRGYVGEVTSSGLYTAAQRPTTYDFTVTKGGRLNEAEITWQRRDGLTDTENGGRGVISGEALKADEAIYIEEGISLSIGDVLNDQGESIAYLAQGDQIEISTGEKLTYHFASQIQLDSDEEILIAYQASNSEASADDIGNSDNKLGRLTFIGDPLRTDLPGDKELSLAEGAESASLDHSLATTNLLTPTAIRDAMRTIDLSLDELNEDRSTVGAALNRVEQRSLTLSRKAIDLSNIHLRLTGADLAQETALLAAEQIQQEMTPFLLNKLKVRSLVALDLINRRRGGRF